ncbi:hypothetical protein V1514DRAFT_8115 [Lipomyces japonicus]|uniref:uncharacterized protein n=1 Tax=Lipomyces japonicus TaxID=56871 RepID=UPI0034CD9FCA
MSMARKTGNKITLTLSRAAFAQMKHKRKTFAIFNPFNRNLLLVFGFYPITKCLPSSGQGRFFSYISQLFSHSFSFSFFSLFFFLRRCRRICKSSKEKNFFFSFFNFAYYSGPTSLDRQNRSFPLGFDFFSFVPIDIIPSWYVIRHKMIFFLFCQM